VKKDLPQIDEEEMTELTPSGPAVTARSPIEMFSLLCPIELIEDITFETNRYKVELNRNRVRNISVSEMKVFLGIILYMGVIKLPNRRMYWGAEARQQHVVDVMTINRFEEIMSVLHVNDNASQKKIGEPGYDRLHKVRPVLDKLRLAYQAVTISESHQAVDEQIIPFKGRHSMKVYMAKKPKKWGYKAWVRAGRSGYVYDYYLCGDNTVVTPPGIPEYIGESGRVVLRLCDSLSHTNKYIYFDNYFASVDLLVELKSRGLNATCTMQAPRSGKCPLKPEKELKKTGRGSNSFQLEKDNEVVVCQWYDNRQVIVASTAHPVHPLVEVERYDKSKKLKVKVKCPFLIQKYNKNMGGVDKADMLLSLYRCFFKSRKWYKRILFHFLDVSLNNAWLLYRKAKGANIQLAKFKLQIARTLMMTDCSVSEEGPSVDRSPRMSVKDIPDTTRYDRIGHFARQEGNSKNAQRCICYNE